MNSALYMGTVRHRRFAPMANRFQYRLFMVYADLEELPEIFTRHPFWSMERRNIVSFRRKDYMGPHDAPLDETIRKFVRRRTGERPQGPIRLLTHFRTWGYCFNPVSMYYCYDGDGRNLKTIVAHINNTPWGESHAYVLARDADIHPVSGWRRFRLDKRFHVSPFMDMDLSYDWRFRVPGRSIGVHMRLLRERNCIFDATLRLQRRPLNRETMTRVLYRYPLMTHKVTSMIYWQALRLWHKRAPFFTHPAKRRTN